MRKRDRLRYKRLAQLLQERRKELDLTLTALARRSGLRQPLLSDFERHERIPDLFDFYRLARGLGMTAEESFTLLKQLVEDQALDLPPIPPPPPRLTKGRPRDPRDRDDW